jgi:cytochrome c-type biogenesis protein CcmH
MTQHGLFFLGCFVLLLLAAVIVWLPFRKRAGISVWLAVLLVPVVAVALYWHWGAPKLLFAFWQKQQDHRLAQAYLKKQKDPQAVLKQFIALLEANPNQPKGWYLLGNIYLKQNQLSKAHTAYQKAHRFAPEEGRYLLALCQVDMSLHQQLAQPLYRELVAWVAANPQDMSARYLLGFAEFHQKRYAPARKQWEQVLSQLPPESEDAKQVLALIAKTHQ